MIGGAGASGSPLGDMGGVKRPRLEGLDDWSTLVWFLRSVLILNVYANYPIVFLSAPVRIGFGPHFTETRL